MNVPPAHFGRRLSSLEVDHKESLLGTRDCSDLVGPFDLIYRDFTRVEFTLRAKSSSRLLVFSRDKVFATLFLAPKRFPAGFHGWSNAWTHLVGFELVHTVNSRLLVVVKTKLGGKNNNEIEHIHNYELGPLDGRRQRLAIDFGWDWYRFHNVADRPRGQAWLHSRLQTKDSGTWATVDPGGRPAHGGWLAFGKDEDVGYRRGPREKLGANRYEWEEVSKKVHLRFVGSPGVPDLEWWIGDIELKKHRPPPFSVMVNTLGYDIAGPQAAVLVPNLQRYRGAEGAKSYVDPIDTARARILRADGSVLRSEREVSISARTESMREPTDHDSGPLKLRPLFWWRIEWPRVTEELRGCVLEVRVTTRDGSFKKELLLSPAFDFEQEIHFRRTYWTLGILNEKQRRAPEDAAPKDKDDNWGGWYDAGNENGENRAHGVFVSGLSHILVHRRAELTTREINAFVDAISFGCRFLRRLGPGNEGEKSLNSGDLEEGLDPRRYEQHLEKCEHYLRAPAPWGDEDDRARARLGHIWHQHSSRFHGRITYEKEGRHYRDQKNKASRIYMSCMGLIDGGRALRNSTRRTPLSA